MENFVAIDFETANGKRSSVCSVGIVVVRDGEITDTYYSLIRPIPNYYSPFHVHKCGPNCVGICRKNSLLWRTTVHLMNLVSALFLMPTTWTIRNIPFIAPVAPRAERSVTNCQITSSILWPNVAGFISKITTTRWPMPKPVLGSQERFSKRAHVVAKKSRRSVDRAKSGME